MIDSFSPYNTDFCVSAFHNMHSHSAPFSPIPTPFISSSHIPTARGIIRDHRLINRWLDKVILITNATSASGLEAARALHATGAKLYIIASDASRATTARADIMATSRGRGRIEILDMDMSNLTSVKQAITSFLQHESKLNILVNNNAIGEGDSPADSSLGHFALTILLLPLLESSSHPQFPSRVVNVSSPVITSGFRHQDTNHSHESALMALYIERVFGPRGIHSLAVHPGGFQQPQIRSLKMKVEVEYVENAGLAEDEQRAATAVWAAVSSAWLGRGDGESVNWDFDVDSQDRLWRQSMHMAGLDRKY